MKKTLATQDGIRSTLKTTSLHKNITLKKSKRFDIDIRKSHKIREKYL